MAANSLPTWQNKHARGLEIVDVCPICSVETEDNFHPFFRCPLARELWRTMSEIWSLPCLESIQNNGTEWLLQVLHPLPEIERSMMLMTLWRAWHIHNEVVHHKLPPPMEVSRRFLASYLDSLIGIRLELSPEPEKGKTIVAYDIAAVRPHVISAVVTAKWFPPTVGWVKLNVDGSYTEDQKAGVGMVLRDDKVSILFSSCRQLFSCHDALEAKLCACMEGLSFALQRSDLPIMVEMDSIIAVKLIQARDLDRSIYSSLVREIKHLMGLRDSCVTHVIRSQNKQSERQLS